MIELRIQTKKEPQPSKSTVNEIGDHLVDYWKLGWLFVESVKEGMLFKKKSPDTKLVGYVLLDFDHQGVYYFASCIESPDGEVTFHHRIYPEYEQIDRILFGHYEAYLSGLTDRHNPIREIREVYKK